MFFYIGPNKNKKIGLNKDQTYDFTHQAYQSYQIRQTHQTHSRAFQAWSPNSLEDSTLQVGVGWHLTDWLGSLSFSSLIILLITSRL